MVLNDHNGERVEREEWRDGERVEEREREGGRWLNKEKKGKWPLKVGGRSASVRVAGGPWTEERRGANWAATEQAREGLRADQQGGEGGSPICTRTEG